MRLKLVTVVALALLAACSRGPAVPPPTYNVALPVNELMAHVVDPAAQAFWRGAGTRIDRQGIHDLSPTTEEGWKHVEDGAAGVIEAGNLLKLPGRARAPLDRWNGYADALTKLGVQAKAAAEAHDKDRVLEIGSEMDGACDDCHEVFRPEPARPGGKT